MKVEKRTSHIVEVSFGEIRQMLSDKGISIPENAFVYPVNRKGSTIYFDKVAFSWEGVNEV